MLQGSAGGVASAKALFGKDELAAILRFGAEELFKRDEQVGESISQGPGVGWKVKLPLQ